MKKKLTLFTVFLALLMTSCDNASSEQKPGPKINVTNIALADTNRIWTKFTNETWLNDSGQLFVTYRDASEQALVRDPGAPMHYDALNEMFYFDLTPEATHFTFIRVDIEDSYYNAKTKELSYEDAVNHVYEITGNINPSLPNEKIVAGKFVPLEITSTTITETFKTNVLAVTDKTSALKVVNYYYHQLTAYERTLFNREVFNEKNGATVISDLISTYSLLETTEEDALALLNSDEASLTVANEADTNFIVPVTLASGTIIKWTSSDTRFIRVFNDDVRVTNAANRKVTLTATLNFFNVNVTKTFEVTVKERPIATALTVTWIVNLPLPLPTGRTLSIGSSFNDWAPSNTEWLDEVVPITETKYAVTKTFPLDETNEQFVISYKWVIYSENDRDQWHGVELSGNRTRRAYYRYGQIRFNDTVNEWENIFGEEGAVMTKKLGEGTLDNTVIAGRRIRIYKPSGYNADGNINYPVIYLHDGQNLFETSTSFAGEWEIDETIEKIKKDHGWDGAIAVGIDNTTNRMGDYMYPTGYISYSGSTPVGDEYMHLIVNEIKPFVDANYKTLTTREHTYLGGSSMGGLISFFGGLHHLETFGNIFAFSSSTQLVSNSSVNIPATLATLDANLLAATKFFLYVGTAGDGNQNWPGEYAGYLLAAGANEAFVETLVAPGYGHNEPAWAKHFPIALKWALGY